MSHWTITTPQRLDIESTSGSIRSVNVKLAGGTVEIVGREDLATPVVDVRAIAGPAVFVKLDQGTLTIEQSTPDSDSAKGKLSLLSKLVKSSVSKSDDFSADVVIHVPRHAEVDVKTATASVTVTGFDRETSVKTATGTITANDLHREIDLVTVSGRMTVDNISGELSIKTVAGTVAITGAELTELSADAVRANVDVELIGDHTEVDVKTVAGRFTCKAPLTAGYDVDVQSPRGEVRILDHDVPVVSGRKLKVEGAGGLKVRGKMLTGALIVNQRGGHQH